MASIYSVKQVNSYIRNMFTQDFALTHICVRGEVSNYKPHPSGHIYFTLKDADGMLSVVMFAGKRGTGLTCQLREGMQVLVTGAISIYEAAGKYQLYAEKIKADGQGDLYAKYLELKEKLQEMGMFDPSFKRPIPQYAAKVGVVTASSGAALQDICQISHRRNPYVQLVLCPAKVQGEGAAKEIADAIHRLDGAGCDVMIVGRGGGSIEDLWAFNEEIVARAIFDAETPIISAVGHEVDFTIADFVADHRAPTPSAAAELAVFSYDDFQRKTQSYLQRMEELIFHKITSQKNQLELLNMRLQNNHPKQHLNEQRMRLLDYQGRMERSITDQLSKTRHRLALLAQTLNGKSPLYRLSGGYAYISKDEKPVDSADSLHAGEEVNLLFRDGSWSARVEEKFPSPMEESRKKKGV